MSSSVFFVGHDRFFQILKNKRETKKRCMGLNERRAMILQNNLCKNTSIRENLLWGRGWVRSH